MSTTPVAPIEVHGERVRRNTRPYVGVMDWHDTINTNPFLKAVQYYGSLEIDGFFRPGILWRFRNVAGLNFQEYWSPSSKSWQDTRYLMKMIIGGECSLADMTPEQAARVAPEAFENRGENNVS